MIDDRRRVLLAQPTPLHSTPLHSTPPHPIHAQCNIICGTEISQEKHAVSEIIAKTHVSSRSLSASPGITRVMTMVVTMATTLVITLVITIDLSIYLSIYIYICRTIDLGASPAFSPNIGAKSKGSLIFDSSASVACCIFGCVGRLNGQGCRPGYGILTSKSWDKLGVFMYLCIYVSMYLCIYVNM